ncbi:MAG: isopentenyl phosphate kinase [Thaumarchaeota archaeon]|nr:isopentenyl phosphate kinase [Candidatus Calditenuaceae archaeon]MDW8187516.1 isopentenyl phosphate kinase [Nitrososphaerota archaeon]
MALSIVKLGGSVLTDKRTGSSELREQLLREIARLLRDHVRDQLILIHGGGTEVHRTALEGRVHLGRGGGTPEGLVKTALVVRRLNQRITELLVDEGIPAFSIPASTIFRTSGGKIRSANLEPFLSGLEEGLVPVTMGDVVFDRELGYTVLSGDSIAVYLAVKLRAKKIVHATDVDGVLIRDREGSTRVAEVLDYEGHKRVQYAGVNDATGGMATKVEEAFEAVASGVEVLIVNGLHPERVVHALLSYPVLGTRLVR